MAANVLNSPRAVQVSVFIVRAFVRLRNLLTQHKELAAKLAELERKFEQKLDKHDREITALIEAIRQLMAPPPDPPRKPIGYHSEIGP
jgi:phytoene dehydrogenase-like protein